MGSCLVLYRSGCVVDRVTFEFQATGGVIPKPDRPPFVAVSMFALYAGCDFSSKTVVVGFRYVVIPLGSLLIGIATTGFVEVLNSGVSRGIAR